MTDGDQHTVESGAAAADAAPTCPLTARPARSSAGAAVIRVLAVDDDEQNLYLLRLQLRGCGIEVDEARDGAEALERARRSVPDLVLSDLLMPVMDGYTLLRHWRADARLASVPFIVYSATYTNPKDERLARELGADAFITKPADPATLMGAIDGALQSARSGISRVELPAQDARMLQAYSEVLMAKLEGKASALEQANRELRVAHTRAQALSQQLVNLREEESARISRELHDELGQALTGLKLDLAWLQRRLGRPPEPGTRATIRQRIQSMSEAIDATVATTRRICTELRPAVLDELGLAAAIDWQAHEFGKRAHIAVDLELPNDIPALDPARTTATFRILQEVLTNVARHARARRVSVHLTVDGGTMQLAVCDDGIGFVAEEMTSSRGLGIAGIRERAALCGGVVDLRSAPGGGTTVSIRMPMTAGTDRELQR